MEQSVIIDTWQLTIQMKLNIERYQRRGSDSIVYLNWIVLWFVLYDLDKQVKVLAESLLLKSSNVLSKNQCSLLISSKIYTFDATKLYQINLQSKH